MHLAPTDDQAAMLATMADHIAGLLPVARLRERRGAEELAAEWHSLMAIGFAAITLPPDADGAGMSAAEEVMIFELLGRHLAPLALVGAAMAGRLAVHAGADARGAILGRPVGIAIGLPGNGRILDARHADHVIELRPDRVALYARPRDAGAIDGLDPSVPVAPLTGFGQPLVERTGEAAMPLFLQMRLLCAAMAGGVAQGARDMAVAYAGQREQFDRPIGSFQAIKHICADMALRCEAASTQTAFAALSAAGRSDSAAFEVAAAKLLADRAAEANAAANIQVHGGMGMAAECDAHFFLKRAAVLRMIAPPRSVELLDIQT